MPPRKIKLKLPRKLRCRRAAQLYPGHQLGRINVSTVLLYSFVVLLVLFPILSLAATSPRGSDRFHSAGSKSRPAPLADSHSSSDHLHHTDHDPAFSNFASNPTTSSTSPIHKNEKRAEGCSPFDGDQDTYGLGIRIGLYFQWVTSSLAYNLVPSEAVTMRGVNNCFQAAMFAGLIFVTLTKGPNGDLRAIEAYLMLLFCMGGVCSGTIYQNEDDDDRDGTAPVDEQLQPTLGNRQRHPNGSTGVGPTATATATATTSASPTASPTQRSTIPLPARTKTVGSRRRSASRYALFEATTLGGYFRLILGCGFIAYGLWFVFKGMDEMIEADRRYNSCKYAFFFVKVELDGWFRTLLKVVFVCASIPAVLSLVVGSLFLLNVARKFIFQEGWKGRVPMALQTDEKVEDEDDQGSNVVRTQSQTSTSATATGTTAQTPDPADPNATTTAATTPKSRPRMDRSQLGLQQIRLRKGNVGFSGALILFIIAVELTIRWNHIGGVMDVGSTGQLLPVIIGVGGVGRVLVKLISDILEEIAIGRERRRDPDSWIERTIGGGGIRVGVGSGGALGGIPGVGFGTMRMQDLKSGSNTSSTTASAGASPIILGARGATNLNTSNPSSSTSQTPFIHLRPNSGSV